MRWSGRQRVGFLTLVPTLMRRLGCDIGETLAQAGLAPDALDDASQYIPFASAAKILAAAAKQTGCEHFGLLLGEQIKPPLLGLAGELMCTAPSLSVALGDFNKFQHLNSTSSVSYLLETDDQALLGYGLMERDVKGARYIYDAAAVAALNIIRSLVSGAQPQKMKLLISHDEPADTTAFRRIFGGPIQFNAEQTGVVFPQSWLKLPMEKVDPLERKRIRERAAAAQSANSPDPLLQLRREVRVALLRGTFQASEIAERLAISKRGLHRRLNEAETTYSALLDETRCEMATQLLANTRMSMNSISLVLRFSEQSVFSRSFDRWTGFTPMAFRTREIAA